MIDSKSGLPFKSGAHSVLTTQWSFASGNLRFTTETAGNVCTTSPSELGLMIRIVFGFSTVFKKSMPTNQQGMFDESTLFDRNAFTKQQDTFDEPTLFVRENRSGYFPTASRFASISGSPASMIFRWVVSISYSRRRICTVWFSIS